MLRRVRLRQISGGDMTQDFFTAYIMILESDGLNEMQLAVAGFSDFALQVIRSRLSQGILDNSLVNETDSLALWSYLLTLSRRESLPYPIVLIDLYPQEQSPRNMSRCEKSCLIYCGHLQYPH